MCHPSPLDLNNALGAERLKIRGSGGDLAPASAVDAIRAGDSCSVEGLSSNYADLRRSSQCDTYGAETDWGALMATNPSATYPLSADQPPSEPLPLPAYPELRGSIEIQGNILAGFRKDHQQLLLLAFGEAEAARAWLSQLIPRIARTDQVATFNELFSAARRQGGGDPEDLKAVWVNVSLTASGFRHLATVDPFPSASTDAFIAGAAASADRLGDSGPSAPSAWAFGRTDQTIHAVLTVQADRPTDLEVELARQYATLARFGVAVAFEQAGDTLPGHRAGHEHFGFKDGISQPGVRGFDPPDGQDDQVLDHPGTDLINPGEFVLGYGGQGEDRSFPGWMTDGSFHVIRRLAQDVPGWWAQIERDVATFTGVESIEPDLLAAKAVGRWRSGTPLAKAPDRDLRSGRDPKEDNDFEFDDDADGTTTVVLAHLGPRPCASGPVGH
jgi:deferrochelatase/peroxidase EfeB